MEQNKREKQEMEFQQKENQRLLELDLEIKKEEEELKKHINDCKLNFFGIIQKMHKVDISLTSSLYKKQHLYEMPELTISTVRKNSSYKDISNFVAIDVETTGLRPKNDDIVEISAVKFIDWEPVEYMSSLINPQKEIPKEATLINNITNEMVKNSPVIDSVVDSFSDFIKGFNVVGYNLEFDLSFLYVNNLNLFTQKRKYYDLLSICRKRINKDDILNYKLNTVCEYYDIYRDDSHRSTSDALATGIIFANLTKKIKEEIYY